MWNPAGFDANAPIYMQIIEKIKTKIIAGEWQPGERIPPVRELSAAFSVNPNTMQRSLSELERQGLLFSERTSGRFVTQSASSISNAREQKAAEILKSFLTQMSNLGYTRQHIVNKIMEGTES